MLSLVTPDARVDDGPEAKLARKGNNQVGEAELPRQRADGEPERSPRRPSVRHSGYEVSQRIRKRIEEIFGWTKTVASFRKTRFRGQARTQLAAHLAAAYNLLRISKLMPA
ncbi:MAG: transposase [Anaeromyxobacteraceae bacterium]